MIAGPLVSCFGGAVITLKRCLLCNMQLWFPWIETQSDEKDWWSDKIERNCLDQYLLMSEIYNIFSDFYHTYTVLFEKIFLEKTSSLWWNNINWSGNYLWKISQPCSRLYHWSYYHQFQEAGNGLSKREMLECSSKKHSKRYHCLLAIAKCCKR